MLLDTLLELDYLLSNQLKSTVAIDETNSFLSHFQVNFSDLFSSHFQVNFSEESLRENIGAFIHSLLVAKPVGLKKSIFAISFQFDDIFLLSSALRSDFMLLNRPNELT